MPGWRSSGLNPRPSAGTSASVPAGWNIACTTSPARVCHRSTNGFSKNTVRPMKKPSVIMVTTITTGINSRSASHLRSMTVPVKADINHAQKSRLPACPPQSAVTRR